MIATLLDPLVPIVPMKDNVDVRRISKDINANVARINISGSLHVNSASVTKKVVYITTVTSLQGAAPAFQM